ncbi:gamma-tubulin complex component 4 homolog [Ctenocephalides felis]|uniref:gamma-tubulin complex component 4 homolog n=1 Tax=Ctenocephalides felis TaxID=7515 RepID=UPI000E6E1908|nr:gamma-tubulin complex component 4 homolog [Ctenocephalides felis]
MTYNKNSLDVISMLNNHENEFLHPCELHIYKEIMKIAAEHSLLYEFCRKYQYRAENENNSEFELPKGLFLQAICRGVDLALAPYRQEVVELEKHALMNPKMTLLMVLSKMSPYKELLHILKYIVSSIYEKRLHGCQILHLVYCELLTGSEIEGRAVRIVFQEVQKILYKLLAYWLFNGELNDTYKEFFIEKVNLMEVSLIRPNVDDSSETTLFENTNSLETQNSEYQINTRMLPKYMPESLAANILFIGRTISMFKSDPRQDKTNVWGDVEKNYYKKLASIQERNDFNISTLESTIIEIKTFVSQHLFQLVVEDADLLKHLTYIKNYYFLGRGELFLEFIKLGTKILNEFPWKNPTGTRDINVTFILAARNMFIGDEVDLFRFILPFEKQEDSTLEHNYLPILPNDVIDGWSTLSLEYKVKWPLHLLFTPAVMDRYNIIFRFLLKVKKTQYELHHVWIGQRSESHLYSNPKVWQLRHQLIFLIEHLQYYLHVDVVESQMSILLNTIKNTRDFDAIQRAHSIFQSNVMSQCFLLIGSSIIGPSTTDETDTEVDNPVHQIMNKVFESCNRFCMEAPKWSAKGIMDESDLKDLENINTCFAILMAALLKLLSALKSQPCGTHLSQLLLRLDFNRWFSVLKHTSDPTPNDYDSFEI